jgi:hypothetical protein
MCPGQKAVLASGYAPSGIANQAISLGARWLAKPYPLRELGAIVGEVLTGKKG